jgi:hypothetical protein
MDLKKSLQKLGLKELPPHINYRIIELEPDKIKYGNLTEELPEIKKGTEALSPFLNIWCMKKLKIKLRTQSEDKNRV